MKSPKVRQMKSRKLIARVVWNGERKEVANGEIIVINGVHYRARLKGKDGEVSVLNLKTCRAGGV